MTLLAALNWHSIAFLFFALLTIGFAIAVVTTSNIVRMAFYLTLALGATSGLFFLAGAEFVGSMQLLIYVGGTLVLLIFGVMLTAQARFISMETSGAEWVLAAILGGALFLLLLQAGFSVESWRNPREDLATVTLATNKTSTPIGLALTGVRIDQLDEPNEDLRRGMSGYLFPFVIISMHLLVVLIGASYMARTKRLGSRAAAETPIPVALPAARQRSFAVTAGIWSGIIVNLLIGLVGLVYWKSPEFRAWAHQRLAVVFGSTDLFPGSAASWLCAVVGLLFLVNVLLLVAVYGWQKWGVVGLVLSTIAQAVAIGNSGLDPLIAWIFFVVAIAPIALLIALLCTGRRPTVWEQME
jgi:NADH:ubiquinone oxidoreductase subunit 6 (subunit J)